MNPFVWPEIVVLAAGLTFVIGYLIINQVMLRIAILIGTGFYIWYYAIVADTPLWTAIWTSVAMGFANVCGLAMLLAKRTRFSLPHAFRDIYENVRAFQMLDPGDFRLLVQNARREILTEERQISTEASEVTDLYFVVKGRPQITKLGQSFEIPGELFVGEVALLLKQKSSATVTLRPGTEVIVWGFEDLRRKMRRHKRFALVLEAVVSRDLARKVAFAVAPNNLDLEAVG